MNGGGSSGNGGHMAGVNQQRESSGRGAVSGPRTGYRGRGRGRGGRSSQGVWVRGPAIAAQGGVIVPPGGQQQSPAENLEGKHVPIKMFSIYVDETDGYLIPLLLRTAATRPV